LQQLEMAALRQACVDTLQLSSVQASLSSQSPSWLQHCAIAAFTQVWLCVLQLSAVQLLPSAQSPSAAQQPGICASTHEPPLQVSLVHGSPSSQSMSALQQPPTGVSVHWWLDTSQPLVRQALLLLQSPPLEQQLLMVPCMQV
jgi:hypothetical protein